MTMGEFLTVPSVRKIREASSLGRAVWRLDGDLVYLDSKGWAWCVPSGFETDFASVPRAPLAYWLTGDSAHMSAVLHDYLCREMYPDKMTWREAADIFREAMEAEGVPAWRRWLMYWAVRLFGENRRETNNGSDC